MILKALLHCWMWQTVVCFRTHISAQWPHSKRFHAWISWGWGAFLIAFGRWVTWNWPLMCMWIQMLVCLNVNSIISRQPVQIISQGRWDRLPCPTNISRDKVADTWMSWEKIIKSWRNLHVSNNSESKFSSFSSSPQALKAIQSETVNTFIAVVISNESWVVNGMTKATYLYFSLLCNWRHFLEVGTNLRKQLISDVFLSCFSYVQHHSYSSILWKCSIYASQMIFVCKLVLISIVLNSFFFNFFFKWFKWLSYPISSHKSFNLAIHRQHQDYITIQTNKGIITILEPVTIFYKIMHEEKVQVVFGPC